jgi:outer membrane autotransporter protein
MRLKLKELTAAVLLLSGAAGAQAQIYKVTLSGLNEIPAVTTTGSGSAIITLNSNTHEMRVRANFKDLIGNTTAAHIHCCVFQPANAGVATTTPTFVGFPTGVQAGSWDNTYNMTAPGTWNAAFITANGGTVGGAETAFVAGAADGRAYLNIHSSTSPGGEIRGNLVRNTFVPAASANTRGLAGALDAMGAGSGALTDRLMTLAALNNAEQGAAMELLLPASSFAVQTVTSNNQFTSFDQMGSRLQGLRLGDDTEGNTGAWLRAVNHNSTQDTEGGFAGFNNEGWDLALGADRELAAGLIAGAAISVGDNSVDFKASQTGSSMSISSFQGSVYASKVLGTGYVEGMVSYGRSETVSNRLAGFAGLATGKAHNNQAAARIGAGVTTTLTPAISVTPQVRIDWSRLSQDAYEELGASGLGLKVAEQSQFRVRASLGAQFDLDIGSTAKPFVRAFWNNDMKDDGTLQRATFVNGSQGFEAVGRGLDSNSYTLGIGVNFITARNWDAAIAYDRLASDSFDANIFHAKVLWQF